MQIRITMIGNQGAWVAEQNVLRLPFRQNLIDLWSVWISQALMRTFRKKCYTRRIESKKSALFLVALILSSRNSIASISSIG